MKRHITARTFAVTLSITAVVTGVIGIIMGAWAIWLDHGLWADRLGNEASLAGLVCLGSLFFGIFAWIAAEA